MITGITQTSPPHPHTSLDIYERMPPNGAYSDNNNNNNNNSNVYTG